MIFGGLVNESHHFLIVRVYHHPKGTTISLNGAGGSANDFQGTTNKNVNYLYSLTLSDIDPALTAKKGGFAPQATRMPPGK